MLLLEEGGFKSRVGSLLLTSEVCINATCKYWTCIFAIKKCWYGVCCHDTYQPDMYINGKYIDVIQTYYRYKYNTTNNIC